MPEEYFCVIYYAGQENSCDMFLTESEKDRLLNCLNQPYNNFCLEGIVRVYNDDYDDLSYTERKITIHLDISNIQSISILENVSIEVFVR